MEKEKKKHKLNKKTVIKILFVLYILVLCTTWALTLGYNKAPDEAMKYDVCKYLLKHKALPHGGDPEIREVNWGISYAFTPILSYIFSAICMGIMSIFTDGPFKIFVSTRIVSILCMCGYAFMNIKISEKLFKGIFKWLYVVLVTLLPQVVFLGSYLNNDSLALFSISIIVYSWILGIEKDWDWKSCIILSIGIGICSLSYYNAYGYILCSAIIYCLSNLIKKIDFKTFLIKGLAIVGIVFVIAGWWFIRNFIIYDGDIFGLTISREYGEKYALDWLKPSNRGTPNNLHWSLKYMLTQTNWIKTSINSFIGVFGNMTVSMKNTTYTVYKYVIVFGFIGLAFDKIYKLIKNIVDKIKNKKISDKSETKNEEKSLEKSEDKKKNKEKVLFNLIMLICGIIPIMLSIYYSYFNDFQPQGRYMMPMIIPLMYFVAKGFEGIFNIIVKNKKIQNMIIGIVIAVWSVAPIYIYFEYIRKFLMFTK